MSTQVDHELKAWMDDWRSEADAAPRTTPTEEIRKHVRRRQHQLIWWVACEVAICVGFLAFILHRALTQTDPVEKIAMGALGLVILTVMVFGAWNWRGAMTASAETTAAYLAIAIERSRRMQRSVRAGWAVLVGEVSVFVPWIWYQLHGDGSAPSVDRAAFAWAFLTFMVLLGVLLILLVQRGIREDVHRLEALRRELTDDLIG